MRYLLLFAIMAILSGCNQVKGAMLATQTEEKCFFQMLFLWHAAVSYGSAEFKLDSEVLPATFITNFVAGKHQIPICQSGSARYPAFSVANGPKCPNGHMWETNVATSHKELVRFLKRSRDQISLNELTNAIFSDSLVTRRAAMRMLANRADENPADIGRILENALQNHDHVVRSIALDGLESLQADVQIQILNRAIKNDDPFIRLKSIKIINSNRKHELIPELIAVLEDETGEVRNEAQATLEKLTGVRHDTIYNWKKWWQEKQSLK